ncbi:Exostosin domain containing protein [Trichuris trichiura]|uniref:Exostosin domain containing protein n=1 Tax=Trichuris trichiura TaxID=36087 RepID=A0A077ZE64_TRITR|nr:Exostosin domain containing protein [Trichuris trichiura]
MYSRKVSSQSHFFAYENGNRVCAKKSDGESIVHERKAILSGAKPNRFDQPLPLDNGYSQDQDVHHQLDDIIDGTEKKIKEASDSLHKSAFAHKSDAVCVAPEEELLNRKKQREPVIFINKIPTNDTYDDDAPFQLDCRWWSCFNPYNCLNHPSGRLTLRLLGSNGTPPWSISTDFVSLMTKSSYFVSNCDDPCLVIGVLSSSSADREMELKRLKSLWRWNGGENVLIFDLLNDSTLGQHSKTLLRTGKAALASCQIRWYLYRPFFDVKVPCVSSDVTPQPKSRSLERQKANRPWTLISAQEVFPLHIKRVLTRLVARHSSNFSFWLPCKLNSERQELCDQRGYSFPYVDVLLKSEFCLILDDSGNAMVMLSRSLQHGCIPVIVGDRNVLPFEEIIDWAE